MDDAVAEGLHTSTITHAAVSSDANYNGIAMNNVVANITDNDAVGVTITESGGTTDVTEGGVGDSYTVVLDSVPTANVDVTVTPDSQTDLGAGAGTAIVLTFTPATALTLQPVNVTAVDDAVAEGLHTSTITHAAVSSDTNYNGIAMNNVVANITDNDAVGVTITESGGTTDVAEGGVGDSYTVVLDSVPTANVDVTVTPDSQTDLGAGAGTAIVLTFIPANAFTPQPVNVTAVDDAVVEGPHTSTITHAAASTDTNYNGISINNVVANVTDNDAASVTIVESGGTTDVTEGGAADSYTVVLDSVPTANVDVTVTPDGQTDLGAGAGTAIVLTFTPANALTPQPVNVTAVDDAVAEGPHTSTITHAAASTDTNYNGISINNVVANVTDNDTAAETILYLAFNQTAALPGGVTAENEDIVAFDGTDFSVFFDGSDVGLAAANVDAFAVIAADEILLSFRAPETVSGIIGTVADSDIVKFNATQLGETTSGTFELFFRGSDVGLSPLEEDIDAIDIHADGRLIVSTIGSFDVPGLAGDDEDLIAFTPDTPGDYSAGTWELYFDGSDVELAREDVDAVALDSNGNIHLSLTSSFAVTGVSGDDEDVVTFMPSQLGTDTAGIYASTLLFDGSQFGLAANDLTAFDLPMPVAMSARAGVRAEVADLPSGLLGTAREGLTSVDVDAAIVRENLAIRQDLMNEMYWPEDYRGLSKSRAVVEQVFAGDAARRRVLPERLSKSNRQISGRDDYRQAVPQRRDISQSDDFYKELGNCFTEIDGWWWDEPTT